MFASWEFTCQEISHPPPPIYVRGVDIRCGKEMGDEVLREFLFGFRESLVIFELQDRHFGAGNGKSLPRGEGGQLVGGAGLGSWPVAPPAVLKLITM